jgi:hypothetical protein
MVHWKLLWGIDELLSASFSVLRDPVYLAGVIRQVGLRQHLHSRYGAEEIDTNSVDGLLQNPAELAELMVLLSNYPIRTALDIGAFNGWTTALMTAYLLRWNPCLQVVGIDPKSWCSEIEQVTLSQLLPLTFARMTSSCLHGQRFDFCFIDGEHHYPSVAADHYHVGQYARIAAFHDINDDETVSAYHAWGGVPRFWQELKQSLTDQAAFYEITHSPIGRRFMGIGVVIRS